MSLESFVEERQPDWEELSATLEAALKKGPSRLPEERVVRAVHLYRAVCADLARLRMLDADSALASKLNRLLARTHSLLYREMPRSSLSVSEFFLVRVPSLFREYWRYTLASFVCSALFFGMAFGSVQKHPEVVSDIMGCCWGDEFSGEKESGDIRDRFRVLPSPVLSSHVTTNNVKVALTAFALGITFGVGTVYMLVVNGTMLGGMAGAFAQSGTSYDFWMTILPHGALELSAIVIAGGTGLMMGYALWCPGGRTRRLALREEAEKAVQLAVGLIPAFVIAGTIEGFVTPLSGLSDSVKVGLGVFAAVVFWSYLLVGGLSDNRTAGEDCSTVNIQ